jgi:inorganic pyrophosphatase
MNLFKIPIGKFYPDLVNVVIESSKGEGKVKYEVDEELGVLVVDRFLNAPVYYPCNYGYIPSTLGGDGDPLDALVISEYSIMPGTVIQSRPIGLMTMEDEGGQDDKIILVPASSIAPELDYIKDINDVSIELRDRIEYFFKYYKALSADKWSKVHGWKSCIEAKQIIKSSYVKHK